MSRARFEPLCVCGCARVCAWVSILSINPPGVHEEASCCQVGESLGRWGPQEEPKNRCHYKLHRAGVSYRGGLLPLLVNLVLNSRATLRTLTRGVSNILEPT